MKQVFPRGDPNDLHVATSTTRPAVFAVVPYMKAPAPLLAAQREAVALRDEMHVGAPKEVSAVADGHQRSRIVTAVEQPLIGRVALLDLVPGQKRSEVATP